MIGLVIASHGRLAEGLIDAAKLIWGDVSHVVGVGLQPGITPETFGEQLAEAARAADDGEGVLLLADLRGGSPFTRACLASRELECPVVAGANLAMLLQALNSRADSSSTELAELAEKAGRNGVFNFNPRRNND